MVSKLSDIQKNIQQLISVKNEIVRIFAVTLYFVLYLFKLTTIDCC